MDSLDDALIGELLEYFDDRANAFCVNPNIGFPPGINISFTLYNYFEITLSVEKNTAYFGLRENKLAISIATVELKEMENKRVYLGTEVLKQLDFEIRLRIPNKFLEAKGWL